MNLSEFKKEYPHLGQIVKKEIENIPTNICSTIKITGIIITNSNGIVSEKEQCWLSILSEILYLNSTYVKNCSKLIKSDLVAARLRGFISNCE